MFEGPKKVEGVWIFGGCGQGIVSLAVVARLTEQRCILVNAWPGEYAGQVLGCCPGAGVACGVVGCSDEVQAIL